MRPDVIQLGAGTRFVSEKACAREFGLTPEQFVSYADHLGARATLMHEGRYYSMLELEWCVFRRTVPSDLLSALSGNAKALWRMFMEWSRLATVKRREAVLEGIRAEWRAKQTKMPEVQGVDAPVTDRKWDIEPPNPETMVSAWHSGKNRTAKAFRGTHEHRASRCVTTFVDQDGKVDAFRDFQA